MSARIFKPAKTAMSSGLARTHDWVLEYTQSSAREVDPLMGWTSSADTQSQVTLRFENKEAAIQYAKQKALAYEVIEPKRVWREFCHDAARRVDALSVGRS